MAVPSGVGVPRPDSSSPVQAVKAMAVASVTTGGSFREVTGRAYPRRACTGKHQAVPPHAHSTTSAEMQHPSRL